MTDTLHSSILRDTGTEPILRGIQPWNRAVHFPASLPATTISVTRMVIVYVPLAFAGRALFGIPGIFAAYAASNLLVGAGAAYWGWVACSGAPQRELASGEA